MTEIFENVMAIKEKIAAAAKKSGRSSEDITLVGVTKTVEAERVNQLLSAGVKVIGENKVQELLLKQGDVNADYNAQWHLIGHLQTNKVKSIIDKVTMIQSVDSIRLAESINKYAGQNNKRMKILIEINIENENTKNGLSPKQLDGFLEIAYKLPYLEIYGIMSIPPARKNAQNSRKSFEKLERLFVDTQKKYDDNHWQILSMGMSNDYEEAIEEGANMVRIGTALFGARL